MVDARGEAGVLLSMTDSSDTIEGACLCSIGAYKIFPVCKKKIVRIVEPDALTRTSISTFTRGENSSYIDVTISSGAIATKQT